MMFRKFGLMALLLGGVAMIFGGCGAFGHVATGDVVSRTFNVADFTAVDIGGSRDIVFRHSENHSVTIEMQESLFDILRVEVRGSTLNIRFDGSVTSIGVRPRVYVYAPLLERVSLSGSVSATADNADIFADIVAISMSGSGNAAFTMDVTRLGIGTSGSSRLEFSGRADNVDIEQSGSGTISALDLQAQDVSIRRSGSGGVYVSVSDNLNISASGSGRVRYRGSPSITQSTTGSGTVSRID